MNHEVVHYGRCDCGKHCDENKGNERLLTSVETREATSMHIIGGNNVLQKRSDFIFFKHPPLSCVFEGKISSNGKLNLRGNGHLML